MEYPEAGHSFMNNHRGYKILKVLRFRAVGYNEPAAMDAAAASWPSSTCTWKTQDHEFRS